jgi:hypothetical protein
MVGPRPERPEFVTLLEEQVPYWRRRLLVKPGVTGWAQLSSGYASHYRAMAEKLSYDLWYMRNQTLIVDLAICVRTVLVMIAALLPAHLGRWIRAAYRPQDRQLPQGPDLSPDQHLQLEVGFSVASIATAEDVRATRS